MIIGITGGTGCGKTTLLEILREHGAAVIDCDAIYHQLLQTDPSLRDAIETQFPGVVKGGVLQRKELGNIVFSDPAALQILNRITHAAVKDEVIRRLTPTPALAAIDAIGLFEGKLAELCQLTVAVTAPEDARIQRLMLRDAISEEYARARIAAQRPQNEFQSLCNYTLHNDTTPQAFREKCLAFLQDLGIIKV